MSVHPPVWKKVSPEEARLTKMWIKEDGKTVPQVAALLHRRKPCVYNLVKNKFKLKKQGRSSSLTRAQITHLIVKLKGYIRAAKGRYMVTVTMLRKRTRTKACTRVILDAKESLSEADSIAGLWRRRREKGQG